MKQVMVALMLMLAVTAMGVQATPRLQEVARVAQGPGNLTVTPEGRILMSLHQFFEPRWRVVEVGEDGQLVPFPNAQWAAGEPQRYSLDSVLGIQSDSRGRVWMLDNGMRSNRTPKLVAWDTASARLLRVIHLPAPATPEGAFVNDLAIDEQHSTIYIADPARGSDAALIVVDIETGLARRVLQGHLSVVPEDLDLVIDGKPVEIRREDGTTIRPRVGVNPIALDTRGEWLYFGPMHGTSLYRVPTRDLRDTTLSPESLANRVERYSDKPICDGISIDQEGNIYVSDIGNNAVGVVDLNRSYRILVQDERLSWPDAFSFGPDGKLYTVVNQLHRTAVLNAGEMSATPPYYIFRIEPLAPGLPGR